MRLTTTETTLTPDSIDNHHNWLIGQGASEHTARAYTSDLRLFLGEQVTPMATVEELDRRARLWLNRNRQPRGTWSPKTTQRRCTALRSFGKFIGHPEVLADYRNPHAARGEAHPLDGGIEAVKAMLLAGHSREQRCLVALCGLCGLRVNEAVSVRIKDVDQENMMLTVHGKGAKDRRVPISTRAWPNIAGGMVAAVLRGDDRLVPIAERTARETITRIGERAGLGHVSSHDLRMTFGTAAYAGSKDLRAVQELLGHASSKTTETYTGVAVTAMRKAAEL